MPNRSTLRSVAVMYLAGVTWCVVLLGVSFVSLEPMSGLYTAVGVEENPVIGAVGRLVVAATLASVVAGILWYSLRRRAATSDLEASSRA